MLDTAPQIAPMLAARTEPAEPRSYSRRQELLQALLQHRELLLKNGLEIRHLMKTDPITVLPMTSVNEVTSLMEKRRLHFLLVCAGGGEVLGVITDRDLTARRGSTAQQLMSRPALTAPLDTPVSSAITFLINENISCLPVVEGGKLCGLLTATDLMLALQCSLQLWMRLAQVLQHDTTWTQELETIIAGLDEDVSSDELAHRVIQAREAMRQKVQDLLNAVDLRADALTGMANRRGLDEMLEISLATKKRYGQPFSLVVVVVDHYERIREACGDAVARSLLKSVGRLIQNAIRTSDFVARHRDDAFAIVMPQTEIVGAETFCGRLKEAARRDEDLDIELRIGTGVVAPEEGENSSDLLARAEAAVK